MCQRKPKLQILAVVLVLCGTEAARSQQQFVPQQMQPVPNQSPIAQMPAIQAGVPPTVNTVQPMHAQQVHPNFPPNYYPAVPATDISGQPVRSPQINPKDYPHPHYRCCSCLNKWGIGCYAHHDHFGSSSFISELRFQFGSSRQFFGENCRPGPTPFPLPPGYDVPYGYWR